MSRISGLLPMLMLALLAAASFWLERAIQGGTSGSRIQRHDPDFWAENISVKRYDTSGFHHSTLTAQKMTHFPDDDTTILEAPRLVYHSAPTTTISGHKGLLGADAKQIALVGEALVTRGGKKGGPPTHIATAVLNLFPDEERAASNHPVTISQGRSVIRGSGLETNNKTGLTVLYGRVNAAIHRKP